MYPTCALHSAFSLEIGELHELEYESPPGSGGFVLADAPYNRRCRCDDEISEHDWFSTEDIKGMVRLCEAVLKDRGHGYLFCTTMKYEN